MGRRRRRSPRRPGPRLPRHPTRGRARLDLPLPRRKHLRPGPNRPLDLRKGPARLPAARLLDPRHPQPRSGSVVRSASRPERSASSCGPRKSPGSRSCSCTKAPTTASAWFRTGRDGPGSGGTGRVFTHCSHPGADRGPLTSANQQTRRWASEAVAAPVLALLWQLRRRPSWAYCSRVRSLGRAGHQREGEMSTAVA